jgi:hypothetical protein
LFDAILAKNILDHPHLFKSPIASSRQSENYVKAISKGIVAYNLEWLLNFDRAVYLDLKIIASSSYRKKSNFIREDFDIICLLHKEIHIIQTLTCYNQILFFFSNLNIASFALLHNRGKMESGLTTIVHKSF